MGSITKHIMRIPMKRAYSRIRPETGQEMHALGKGTGRRNAIFIIRISEQAT